VGRIEGSREPTKARRLLRGGEDRLGDPSFVDFYDPDHSDQEHRYIIIGVSNRGRLLLVSYTEREDVFRLISARKATAKEREAYERA
jgi:uncharacterized DUF497 family protein